MPLQEITNVAPTSADKVLTPKRTPKRKVVKTKTEKRASAYDGILDELNGHLEQMGDAHDLAQETIHSLKEHDIHITPLKEQSVARAPVTISNPTETQSEKTTLITPAPPTPAKTLTTPTPVVVKKQLPAVHTPVEKSRKGARHHLEPY